VSAAASRRRRSAHGEGHGTDERWLLTYADMITLLMVLFVVMYAISTTDLRKFTALVQSVGEAFHVGVMDSSASATGQDGLSPAGPEGLLDPAVDPASADLAGVEAMIRDYAIAAGLDDRVDVDRVPEGIAIRLSGGLLFTSGRAVLTEASASLLAQIAAVVRPLPHAIRVEGHTDDLAPDGALFKDNWELSTARALAVVRALAASGLDARLLAGAGHADNRPLVANSDEASRARNRRVDILILYPTASPAAEPSAPATFDPGVHP
jgi:chemotaxis protein MotB